MKKNLNILLVLSFVIGCFNLQGQIIMHPDNENAFPKTSLNAYSFNTYLQEGKLDLFDLVDFAAANHFQAIDITAYYFSDYPEVPDDNFIYKLKRYAFLKGIDISGTGVKNDFAQADSEARAADVELVKRWIDVASKLGAPVIRVFAGEIPEGHEQNREEIAEYMAAALRECARYGKQKGVLVGVQNHGDFLATSEQCIDMVKRVNSDWFGLIVDTGKFITEDPYRDIAETIPYAVNFQIKESPINPRSPVKTDLKRLMKIINKSGYRGYLPIETLEIKGNPRPVPDIPYNPYEVVPAFFEKVRSSLEEEFNVMY